MRLYATKKIGGFPVEWADLGPAHPLSSSVGMCPDSLPPISPVLALTYRSGNLYPKLLFCPDESLGALGVS